MNAALRHQMISASAGSGKTFQLSSRYIRLLAAGVDPASIVALTFTRKAAAEIFDRIIRRLALAAQQPDELDTLNGTTGLALDAGQVRSLLQKLIRAMPTLRIGTLDSFLARVVRLFSFELGLQGEFGILEGFPLEEARQDALLKTLSGHLPDETKTDFHRQFKQATFGREERTVFEKITGFIQDYQPFLQAAPDGRCWGNPERIWPGGHPLLDGPAITRETFDAALDRLAAAPFDASWSKLIELLRGFDGNRLPGENTLTKQLLEQCAAWSKNDVELTFRKKAYPLTPDHRDALDTAVRFLFQRILSARCLRSQGIFQILSRYETVYGQTIRRAGRISFQDIIDLLANGGAQTGGACRLTQEPAEYSDERLYIDYRLDGRFDHWMLDEFQDTSTAQWAVLSNLIDEILQDTEGRRSFFYVGDVKQAIYGWRGGDARLFRQIYDQYHPAIERETLSLSRRSAPAVINAVNAVFSSLTPEEQLPAPVIARWNENWETHQTVLKDTPGYAVLYELPKNERNSDEDDPRFALTSELLRPLLDQPLRHGIAILVRSAKQGLAMVDYLRSQGFDTLWEGDSGIADNTVVAAFLSLIKLAEHPGDNLAWRHINMTPLRSVAERLKLTRDTLSAHLLRDIHLRGFQHLIGRWIAECERLNPNGFSAFTRARLLQLLQCAQEFDLAHPRQTVPFIQFVQNRRERTEAPSGTIRVLTMHKAKGLEFDAVFLPDLQSDALDSLGRGETGLVLHRAPPTEADSSDWVLYYPPASFSAADAVLSAHLDALREQQAYESLCLLYVAMTRARQGLYMITLDPGKSSDTLYASALLKKQLAGKSTTPSSRSDILFETGHADWFQTAPPAPESKPAPSAAPAARPIERPPIRLERRLPSAEADAHLKAEHLFSIHGRDAAEYGTAMHALFEQLEWLEPNAETLCLEHLAAMPLDETIRARLREEFSRALAAPDIRRALAKPSQPADLWREKRFEIALGNRWISGCFDRVTILLDPAGKPCAATILDYKTDQFPDTEDDFARAVESHREQLELYRDVLSVLAGLPPERITLSLLFTRRARLHVWPHSHPDKI